MALLVGVDVGTSRIKSVLYDPSSGRVLSVAALPTPTRHPEPDCGEYDPDDIWNGVASTMRKAAGNRGREVAAVAVASVGEAGVPLDPRGAPLFPFIAWNDRRTEPLARWWADKCDPQWLYEITGLAPRHIYGINKLLWLRQHHPLRYGDMRHWLSVEDFVLYRLTGRFATDYSIASRTMAFDQRLSDWSIEVLGLAGVSRDIWPQALPSGSIVGTLTEHAAAVTGLGQQTVAVTGGHDHLCGALAAGLLDPGVALDSMGTAQALLALSEDFNPLPGLRQAGLSCYHFVVPGRYVVQAGLSAAGGSLAWLAKILCYGSGAAQASRNTSRDIVADLDQLLVAAASVAPGSRGLLWLPHFMGSGSPENDADSRAALLGLTTSHSEAEIVRALLEALCYWLRQKIVLLDEELGMAVREVIAIGGVTRSEFWRQLKADVVGLTVRVPDVTEATAVGAALLAGIGAGVFADAPAAVDSLRLRDFVYRPDPDRFASYGPLYRELYLPAYAQLRELSHRLASLQGST